MFICNVCKKVFPDFKSYGMRMNYRFGYGSKYDGDIFDMTICDDCADKVADAIAAVCTISPHLTVDDSFFPDSADTDESVFDDESYCDYCDEDDCENCPHCDDDDDDSDDFSGGTTSTLPRS